LVSVAGGWLGGLGGVEAEGEPVGECEGESEGVGLTDDATHGAFGVLAGEVVATEVVVVDVVGEHVPYGGQDRVFQGDDCFLLAQPGCEAW
jgi:hypothetical protein